MPQSFRSRALALLRDHPHPEKAALVTILTGKTGVSSTGFPYISESSFRTFLREVSHLFAEGNALLDWLARAEQKIEKAKSFSENERQSLKRALSVLRNIVFSSSICAPSDLWILRHVLAVHSETGVSEYFRKGRASDPETLAGQLNLDPQQLRWDLSFLHTRGYLFVRDRKYSMARIPQAHEVIHADDSIPSEFLRDMVEPLIAVLSTKRVSPKEEDLVRRFLSYTPRASRRIGWPATRAEIETGYRLLPLILALHVLKVSKEPGSKLRDAVPALTPEMKTLLRRAGVIESDTSLTSLGVRVLNRGPGPFGIIHAYVPYMQALQDSLTGRKTTAWVQRSKNISASQEANRKTFEMANDALDRFCADQDFSYDVFIEHALGMGEATRQRLQRIGEHRIRYFGADLEDDAIQRAIERQRQGLLPSNMTFISGADIGKPHLVIDAIRRAGYATQAAPMFVGNGFHEIRGQTNERVIAIFREYCDAGIMIVFTEESALGDQDLLATGWNTYHAGFRYVHELSGQGLRPASGTDRNGRHSWKICAALGGYAVLPKYCTHTRTIYPFPRKGGYNPPISMTYFCVPATMATTLGFYPTNWSAAHMNRNRRSP